MLRISYSGELLSHFFYLSLSTRKIPKVWKDDSDRPLFKFGDPRDLNNYRPISRLSCLVKIFEKIVNLQLHSFLDEHCILKAYQSGFRPGHSTTSAATQVDDIISGIDKKKHCAALFIDLSKAFDTVDHLLLLNRLSSIGLDLAACRWFKII